MLLSPSNAILILYIAMPHILYEFIREEGGKEVDFGEIVETDVRKQKS